MGDESAASSEIEVPNENIPEPLERPSGGRSRGPGGILPEVLRDIKHERGGILTRSTTDRSPGWMLCCVGFYACESGIL